MLSDASDAHAVHFVIGNVRVAVGKSAQLLLGVGVLPLTSDYDADRTEDPLRYVIAYGSEGLVLDHHRLDIGVEQIYVERPEPAVYRIRLVSHERILPVWEGVLRLPPAAPRQEPS